MQMLRISPSHTAAHFPSLSMFGWYILVTNLSFCQPHPASTYSRRLERELVPELDAEPELAAGVWPRLLSAHF